MYGPEQRKKIDSYLSVVRAILTTSLSTARLADALPMTTLSQLGEAGRLVPVSPEQVHRLFQSVLSVKFCWSSNRHAILRSRLSRADICISQSNTAELPTRIRSKKIAVGSADVRT